MPPSKPVSLGLYGLAAFLIIAGTWVWYYPHIEDDALISARYAMRLVEGKGLSWNDGYFVEGYSNLSWVVMTAGLMKLGISPFAAVRILGGAVTLITLAAFVVVGLRAARGHTLGTVFVLVCATLHAPIINALGGLEAPLIFAGVYFAARALIRWWEDGSPKWLFLASLALAVLCITRPDGPLFTAIAGLSLLLAWTTPQYFLRQTAILFTLPIAFTLGQLIYRQMTYDAWVPNTARVKLDAGSNALSEGMNYIASAALANIVLILPILITLLVRPKNFPKNNNRLGRDGHNLVRIHRLYWW